MKILIITGGTSSERKISLISAKTVKQALQANGHEVALVDFKKGYAALRKVISRFEMVFPVMHGKEGEDGTLYQFLRSVKKPFVGCSLRGAKMSADKFLFKKYCDQKGIPTAAWKRVKKTDDIVHFGFPCVLKAAHGGSSHEVTVLHTKSDLLNARVKKILKLKDRLFVEIFLNGVEITVGTLRGKVLPVLEIIPPQKGWFDYKNKYSGQTRETPFAPLVSKKIQKRAQRIALQIHRDLNLGNFSRTDLIVTGGALHVLEINNPGGVGLTPQSLLPKAAKAVGISFRQMVEKMLQLDK